MLCVVAVQQERLDLGNMTEGNLDNINAERHQAYIEFLMQVLLATADSNSDPKVIYPVLQANLDKLDTNFVVVLQNWAETKLSEVESSAAEAIASVINEFSNLIQQFPLGSKETNVEISIIGYEISLTVFTYDSHLKDWATIQNNLGNAYCNRISGDKAENLEMAITAYKMALQVRTREALPIQWSDTQSNLGNAYSERISGDKAKNLELAITAYKMSLQVRTREALPIQWSDTQSNLGNAYSERILGDKAKNLELAITAYKMALQVHTREALPIQWADTQNNLGVAYWDRKLGDRAENLELAITAYKMALQVRTREALPIQWADTQNNLGVAYWDRKLGDRAENLELAITAYKMALQVRTREALPIDWAGTQNNLGLAYFYRILGDKAENLELAIIALQKVLQVYTRETFPIQWAMTQNNLGLVYSERKLGERVDNLELAITAYKMSLQVRTREALPIQWAMTQNNLGEAYRNRISDDRAKNLELAITAYKMTLQVFTRETLPIDWAGTQKILGNAYLYRKLGDRAENLEMAIAAYQNALEVYTRDAFPQDWAQTQNNLAAAYRNRIRGEKAENLEKAIASYQNALEVLTPEADPINCLQTSRNLGDLYFTQSDWQPTIDAYQQAITAVELSRSWAMNDQRRQEIMAEAIEVYQKQVQAYINTEQWDKAIETVERSKARNLVELLTNRDLYPKGDVPQEIIDKLDVLRRNIPSIERQLQVVIDQLSGNRDDKQQQQRLSLEESQKRLQQELQQSRQQLDQVLNQIKPFDPSFSITERVEQIPFNEIQSLIDENTAIIEWYVTNDSIITSVITRNSSKPIIIQSLAEDREAFVNWVAQYLSTYYERNDQWKHDLVSHLAELAELLKIDDIFSEINNIFTQKGIQCDHLILIPHRFLHLLPLHALPLSNGDLLCDRFSRGVSYAPSCQILQLTQRYQRPHFNRLFAIQNPTEDLVFTNLEVETVCSSFSPTTVLAKEAAREADVKTHPDLPLAHCNHFSCHGYFNVNSPLESALILAETAQSNSENTEDGRLTLAEIFALNLNQCRLVTLSACETGMADFKSLSDEYISLPSGFLFAGSPNVVSSLWLADDLATTFLMIKFYENLKQYPTLSSGTVALALNQAQK